MNNVAYTELRNNLAKYLDQVVNDRDALVVTRQNHPSVVMLALDEYESMSETLHLLSSPANAQHLLASIAEAEVGATVEHELTDG